MDSSLSLYILGYIVMEYKKIFITLWPATVIRHKRTNERVSSIQQNYRTSEIIFWTKIGPTSCHTDSCIFVESTKK